MYTSMASVNPAPPMGTRATTPQPFHSPHGMMSDNTVTDPGPCRIRNATMVKPSPAVNHRIIFVIITLILTPFPEHAVLPLSTPIPWIC
jgi:hypothetical protein